ncbi:dsRBD fold-containing protein [Streptomyces xanthii]|uniref:DUF1876 domain-containing protein n=1 Tax=Streptomyces xanthii TaxID=2768069 RepID=A0A7H1B0P2_9ACTN|nr:dsRBD fold-containing protein [Streptomyces xanthii]QNS02297.1 DUF1876 domain-containing protein [Streptomyces xanthii]
MSHTTEWTARVHLFEEDRSTTARVDLDTGTTRLTERGTARCNPVDTDVPEIGDELAAARALEKLAGRLKGIAYQDMKAAGNDRAPGTEAEDGWPDMGR